MGHIPQDLFRSDSKEKPVAYQKNTRLIGGFIGSLAFLLLIYCTVRSRRCLQIVLNQINLNSS